MKFRSGSLGRTFPVIRCNTRRSVGGTWRHGANFRFYRGRGGSSKFKEECSKEKRCSGCCITICSGFRIQNADSEDLQSSTVGRIKSNFGSVSEIFQAGLVFGISCGQPDSMRLLRCINQLENPKIHNRKEVERTLRPAWCVQNHLNSLIFDHGIIQNGQNRGSDFEKGGGRAFLEVLAIPNTGTANFCRRIFTKTICWN